MVCNPCRKKKHDECEYGSTCTCQHRANCVLFETAEGPVVGEKKEVNDSDES